MRCHRSWDLSFDLRQLNLLLAGNTKNISTLVGFAEPLSQTVDRPVPILWSLRRIAIHHSMFLKNLPLRATRYMHHEILIRDGTPAVVGAGEKASIVAS